MSPTLWSVFALATLVITLSPGPNVLIVLNHAARYGLRSIAVTIAGNLSCQLLFIGAVGLGVGALLTTESSFYRWMKYAGAAYLILLGCKILYGILWQSRRRTFAAPSEAERADVVPSPTRRYLAAFAVAASNPQTLLFMSAFLPQFVSQDRPILPQFVIMFLTLAAIITSVHVVYAFMLVTMKSRLSGSINSNAVPSITGAMFILLGFSLGMSK